MSDQRRPLWSLCHATARLPHGWRPAHDAWKAACSDWSQVEYILGLDQVDYQNWPMPDELGAMGIKMAVNSGRQCAVDAWNAAGKTSTGRFLITVADDLFPPDRWDLELLNVLDNWAWKHKWDTPQDSVDYALSCELMVEVRSGTSPADDEWMRVQLHSFITRKYYERIGNFFYPEYVGMYADCDATEMARMHEVMVDARHLTFQHRHWIGTSVPQDSIYQRQNDQKNYDLGLEILGRRRASNFTGANHDPRRLTGIPESMQDVDVRGPYLGLSRKDWKP